MSNETVVPATIQETATTTTPAPQAPVTLPAETTEAEIPSLIDEAMEGSQPKADAEVKEEGAEKGVVPETYEIKVPDGMTLDKASLDLFTPLFKELGITAEGAQKLADQYISLVNSSADKVRQESLDSFKKIVEEWKDETTKFLGADAKSQLAYVGKALNKFGSKELREVLNETGVGNHKAIVDFLATVGKTISEDAFVEGGSPNKADPLKALYPTMQQ